MSIMRRPPRFELLAVDQVDEIGHGPDVGDLVIGTSIAYSSSISITMSMAANESNSQVARQLGRRAELAPRRRRMRRRIRDTAS